MGPTNRTDRDTWIVRILSGRRCSVFVLSSIAVGAIGLCAIASATPARAEALILVDANSGKVLHAENATYPWHPASTTKLMTLYMTLSALRDQRITPDTLFTVSTNAALQSPTKMGFAAGTQVTVDNAIKMMMVKSANDMAVMLAEGLGGTVDQFAAGNDRHSASPGHDAKPTTSIPTACRTTTRLLRRAISPFSPARSFTISRNTVSTGTFRRSNIGRRIVRNYNPLLGRYPGADGMKTGFVCASGFNLVATAERDNKRFIAVVLGAPSSGERAVKAAELLQYGFNQGPLSWLTPSLGTVDTLTPIDAAPPDLTDEMCGRHRQRPATEEDDPDADLGNSRRRPATVRKPVRNFR